MYRFRWVACQLDHLCELPTDRARKQALDKLPPTLSATYERILMKVEGYPEHVKQMVQRMLLIISASSPRPRDPLRFDEARELISLADDSDTLYEDEVVEKTEILRWCSSLVRTSIHGFNIEFAHFSVKEYLQGECLKHSILSFYGVSEEKASKVIGSLCIRYLTLKNHERLPRNEEDEIGRMMERRQHRSFYEYASIYWPHYLYYDETSQGQFFHLVHGFFQSPKTPSFCAWAIELIHHCINLEVDQCEFEILESPLDVIPVLAIISAVVRPDFTPLHLAAALWMPGLCRQLLKEGANPSLRSKFGTPLHCAMGGLLVFTEHDKPVEKKGEFYEVLPSRFERRDVRRETVQLLLGAGSNTELQFISPLWVTPVSTLSLAVISSDLYYQIEVVGDLLTSGTTILDEDIPYFSNHYVECIKDGDLLADEYNDGRAYVKIMRSIRKQRISGTPASRLYSLTRTFLRNMRILQPDQILFSLHEAADEELLEVLEKWIQDNDVCKLEKLLKTVRSEVVRRARFDKHRPGWTALHLATNFKSLEVVDALLNYGLDPNIDAADGTTPVDMCTDVDILRALLKHGASKLQGQSLVVRQS